MFGRRGTFATGVYVVGLVDGTLIAMARAANLLIARGAYAVAAMMYPEDQIELRQGARIVDN